MAHPKVSLPANADTGAATAVKPRHFVLEVGDEAVGVLTVQRGRFVFHTARAGLDSLQGESFRSLSSARRAVRQKLAGGHAAGAAHRSLRRAHG